MFLYGILLKIAHGGVVPPANVYDPGAAQGLSGIFLVNAWDVALVLAPILLLFLPFQFFLIKLPKRSC